MEASLALPEQIDQQAALCNDHKTQTVCINVTVCFSVASRHFRGAIGTAPNGLSLATASDPLGGEIISKGASRPSLPDLQYNLTADLLHKPSFSHRFYFHGNGSSDSTRGRVRARPGQLACTTHVAYQKVRHRRHTSPNTTTSCRHALLGGVTSRFCRFCFRPNHRRTSETFSRRCSSKCRTSTERRATLGAPPKPSLRSNPSCSRAPDTRTPSATRYPQQIRPAATPGINKVNKCTNKCMSSQRTDKKFKIPIG